MSTYLITEYNKFLENKSFIEKGYDKLKEFLSKISKSLIGFFKLDGVKPYVYKGGIRGDLKRDGKIVLSVTDFTGVKNTEPSSTMLKAVKEAKVDQELGSDAGIPNVDVEGLMFELDMAYKTKKPLFVWGAIGISKTTTIEDYCAKNNLTLFSFNAQSMEPSDVNGLPYNKAEKNEEGEEIVITRTGESGLFPRDNGSNNKGGFIFIDEYNLAPSHVFKVLQLITSPNRRIGSYTLPSQWVIVAAGNRAGEADITPFNAAQSTRFTFVNFVLSLEEWEKNFATKKSKEFSDKIGKDVPNIIPEVLSFLKFPAFSQYFHNVDEDMITVGGRNFAIPRTWHEACRRYYNYVIDNKKEPSEKIMYQIFASQIDPAIATLFVNFYKLLKNFSVEEIQTVYSNPEKAKLPKKEKNQFVPDETAAIITAIVDYKKANEITPGEFDNVLKYAMMLSNEYGALLVTSMISKHSGLLLGADSKEFISKLKNLKEASEKFNIKRER